MHIFVMTLGAVVSLAAACTEFGASPTPVADAGSPDGGDAGSPDADAATPAPCELLGKFDASFDDGTFGPFLDRVTSDGGGLALIEGGVRATVPPGEGTRAYLTKVFPLVSKRFGHGRLRFKLRDFKKESTVSYAELGCSLRLARDGSGSTTVRVELSESSLAIDEGVFAGSQEIPSGDGVVFGTVGNIPATRVLDLEFRRVDGGIATRARVDSDPVQERTSELRAEPDSLEVRCGFNFAKSSAGFAIVIDDVDLELCALGEP